MATLADVLIIDRFTRRVIGRPWLSVAIDLATRSVPVTWLSPVTGVRQEPDAGRACVLVRTTVTDRSPRAPIVARYGRGVGLFESTSDT